MLKDHPLPPASSLTARGAQFAYPDSTARAGAAPESSGPAASEQWPLVPAILIDHARRQTGLHDFGTEPFLDSLGAICDSLEREMELNRRGRENAYRRLLHILATRLRLEALWQRRPEILEQAVRAPLFIVGLPRSGTTFLHRLMAQDPGLRSAPFWELINPLPLGDPEQAPPQPDPRIALAEQAIRRLHLVAPELIQMHEMEAEAPDEDISLLSLGFSSMAFEFSFTVPSYVRYYTSIDHTGGYRYFKRVLQTLQWLRGGTRWVLKAPSHMEQLKPLLAVFPDATLIQTHRDAVTTTVSLVSLTCYGVRNYFDHPNPLLMGKTLSAAVERLLRGIARDRAPGDKRFVDVAFRDMMRDPIGAVEQIYAAAGMQLGEAARERMRAWLAENRRGKHGKHAYAAVDFGIDVQERRQALSFYHDSFNVPAEDSE
jgi:hypothetical protein